MLKRLKCPNCLSQARQVKDKDGLVTCGKCSSSYFENSKATVKKDSTGVFSDMSDNEEGESFFSDNYRPTDNEDSDYEDYLKETTKGMFDSDQEEPLKQEPGSGSGGLFDDLDSADSDQDNKEEEAVRKKRKEIKKKEARKKAKTKDVEDDKNMKLPAIFSLDWDNHKSKGKDVEDAFSDMDDDDTLHKKPEKRRLSDLSSSSDEEEPMKVFDPKRNVDVQESASSSRPRKTNISRASLRFNPYIVFNKLTRKKLSEENPYLTNIELSKLVSKAWRSMEETQKEKFIQEQKAKRDEMTTIQKKLTKKVPSGNGYIIYSAKELPKVKKEYPDIKAINDLSSIIGIRWKGLSDEEREVYKQQAKKEREDWIRDNPEEHQLHLNRMISKIKATKASRKKQ